MVMTKEMMKIIEENRAYFATATTDGVPNVVPIGNIKPLHNKKVLVADNYMIKTHANQKANPKEALVMHYAAKYPYQFKELLK